MPIGSIVRSTRTTSRQVKMYTYKQRNVNAFEGYFQVLPENSKKLRLNRCIYLHHSSCLSNQDNNHYHTNRVRCYIRHM